MPASKEKMALKTALLAPAGAIMPWGIQQLLSGEPAVGATALLIGTIFIAGYVAIQEYDLPYEEEIIDVIESWDADATEDVAKDVSERVGEKAEDVTEESEG